MAMDHLVSTMHLHPIVDHFTIALLSLAIICDVVGATLQLVSSRLKFRPTFAEWFEHCAVILIACGAIAIAGSYLTGDAEADRLWDTMPPAAQSLLFTDIGAARLLAHAT